MRTQRNTLLIILNAAIIGLMLLVLTLLFTRPAQAGVITRTLDFQDNPPELDGRLNFDYGGLRFSPSCRIHRGHGNEGQIWLQSDHDNSNCDGLLPNGEGDPYLPPNPDFLGFGNEDFYVDRRGAPFTLQGLAGVGFAGTVFSVVSSRGGVFSATVPDRSNYPDSYVLPYEWFALDGPLWTDITWFTLANDILIGWQQHQGWDDIRYSYHGQVPEPSTLGLLVAGLAVAFRWRFAKRFFHWRDA